jgi:very-short-patch-repair endonuclease
LKVAIEYDGQKYHSSPAAKAADKERDAELRTRGWRVIHVNKFNWNEFLAHLNAYVTGERSFAP